MRNPIIMLAYSTVLVLALPLAGQERPNLSGTWNLNSSKSQLHASKMAGATWVIKEGDTSIQIVENEEGDNKKLELTCSTDGKECKISGEKATASFWYNGALLVEMETKGDRVTRYRMKLSDDGQTLTVDTTSIVPQSSQDDILVFQKHA